MKCTGLFGAVDGGAQSQWAATDPLVQASSIPVLGKGIFRGSMSNATEREGGGQLDTSVGHEEPKSNALF